MVAPQCQEALRGAAGGWVVVPSALVGYPLADFQFVPLLPPVLYVFAEVAAVVFPHSLDKEGGGAGFPGP